MGISQISSKRQILQRKKDCLLRIRQFFDFLEGLEVLLGMTMGIRPERILVRGHNIGSVRRER